MRLILKYLLSELHQEYFKPNSFKKIRNKFFRVFDGVEQEICFQSSSFNYPGSSTTFYVNVYIGFPDIPMEIKRYKYSGDGRINNIVPRAPQQFDLTEENYQEIKKDLLKFIPQIFEGIENHYTDIRRRAKKGLKTPIPLPESWKKDEK